MIAPKDGVTFRQMLGSGRFYYGAEVVTTRGFAPADAPDGLVSFARALLADLRIGWISITDNPGGAPMLPPDWLVEKTGADPAHVVVHLTCKDQNRNGLESSAWRYANSGLKHVLALTGDLPGGGFGGRAAGVFDLDSVALIALLRSMNDGLVIAGRRGQPEKLAEADFFIGCAVSPFKRFERELMPQYFKLLRKIAAGAHWIIPQLGYDMRKFQEVKLLLASRGLDLPVVGNVYLLTKGVAKLFHSGKLAGCVVTDALLQQCERYAAGPDKGRQYFRELAAKQLAVFKGLGFAAGYIGGIARHEGFAEVIDLAESYGSDDWREFMKELQFSQPDEFFLFEHDPATGLGEPTRINPAYLDSLKRRPHTRESTFGYRLSRLVHRWFFTRGRGFYPMMERIYRRWERKPGLAARLAYRLERSAKGAMYGCEDCGDCSLPDCTYLCPRFACSKGGRNGPCGGSAEGRCELGDKECLWARAYERLKAYGESEQLLDRPVTIYNAELQHTSSWANTYLGRDHYAGEKKQGE
ncbi:MAG: methylenetetrahydrofolate reductase C-terminal domain-containing protein [Planctomycetota bacterium]